MEINEIDYNKEFYTEKIKELTDELEESKSNVILFKETRCDDVPVGKTKIGGFPDLPPEIEYPEVESYTNDKGNIIPAEKLPLVCQFNCEDVTAVYSHKAIPPNGMVYVFWNGYDPKYCKKKYNINTLKVFYWNGDTSNLVRRTPDDVPEVLEEFKVDFDTYEERCISNIEYIVDNLIEELECDCNEAEIEYYNTEEYDILKALPEKCDIYGCSKIFGYKPEALHNDGCDFNPFLMIDYSIFKNHGALWSAYFDFDLREIHDSPGWHLIPATIDYDAD